MALEDDESRKVMVVVDQDDGWRPLMRNDNAGRLSHSSTQDRAR